MPHIPASANPKMMDQNQTIPGIDGNWSAMSQASGASEADETALGDA
jgi:hypothetical protein